jgi:hypothetical protein
VKPDKLSRDFNASSRDFNASTITAYNISEAKSAIRNIKTKPAVITFQLTTNDIKTSTCNQVTQDYCTLVDDTAKKFPGCKIIISQAPNRQDSGKLATQSKVVNASLHDHYQERKDVSFIRNTNVTSLTADGVHLDHYGTSALARNIKAAVSTALGLSLCLLPPTGNHPSNHHRNNPRNYNGKSQHNGNIQSGFNNKYSGYMDEDSSGYHYNRRYNQGNIQSGFNDNYSGYIDEDSSGYHYNRRYNQDYTPRA